MLSLKGHELFSLILEKLHSISAEVEAQLNLKQLLTKEQLYFKEKIEEAQLQLTSPTLEFRSLDSCSTGKKHGFISCIQENFKYAWNN